MAGVNIFLLVNKLLHFLPDKYFKTVFWVAVCFNYFLSMAIF